MRKDTVYLDWDEIDRLMRARKMSGADVSAIIDPAKDRRALQN